MFSRDSKTVMRLLIVSAIFLIAAAACNVDADVIYVGMAEEGVTADGLAYDENDIITADPDDATPAWSTLFDGENFGLDDEHHSISAFSYNDDQVFNPFGADVVGDMELFLSFTANRAKVPGIPGRVFGQDIVRFYTPDGIDYEYEMLFDGSDVDLTNGTEKIDGFSFWPAETISVVAPDVELPADCAAGVIFISTRGNYRVSADHLDGGHLNGPGSDVLAFCASNLGQDTAGFWFRVFQASQADLLPRSAMSSIDVYDLQMVAADADGGNLPVNMSFFFAARVPFEAEGGSVSGDVSQLFVGGVDAGGHFVDGPHYDLASGTQVPAVNGLVRSLGIQEIGEFPGLNAAGR